ncbi:MAG: D-alanyl-D-alanine carboxypeptidase/D-alanyl-D-alanine-endopeptidase [Bryobacteraceae bacterium]|jgi:D-alanyl-D-alanine carboxypeptidase/D-alanyl-D-alanine-endopeptidase (penicillin-binding protein 4)
MTRLLAVALGVAILVPFATAADLASRLDHIVDTAAPLSHAFVGMRVLRLSDGRVLYAHNSERLFVPASNMKLFTTALALSKLSAEYKLSTQIGAEVPIDASGALPGDLELVGGGDPSLSGREYPYRSHTAASAIYSFRAIDELADQLVSRGLKRIEGNIVGDDSRYVWEPQPGPWSSDSATREYGAPVSALILDDNTFALTLRPGVHAGESARITLTPPFENFVIDNRVVTSERGARKIQVYRSASGRELHVWGVIPRGDAGYTQELAIGDPALYAAEVLRDALQQRGISIRGEAVARHRFPDEAASAPAKLDVVLAERESPPLFELLQVVDKVSQNLHAEMLLREVAVASGHMGSPEAGLAAMDEFLTSIGISAEEYQFTDGSGLSRATLVSPSAITKLLVHMHQSPHHEEWLNLLPIGGEDGTLGSRFAGHPEARSIRAKTGTLDHVKAISGYAETPAYGPVAFSLLVNNFEEPGPGVTKAIDELVLALLQ